MSDAGAPPVRWEWRGRALVVVLDNPPVNVIGQGVRAGLLAALEAAEGAERVVITGAGAAFAAGADAKEFDAAPLPPHLPEVLARLEGLPSVAAINGTALGGGLEIALACRVRIAAPGAMLGLPEVTLGVVPGAGGTQRLPRLVGVAAAAGMIAEGRVMRADAAPPGLVDALAEDPLAAALALDGAALAAAVPALARAVPEADASAVAAARAAAGKRARGQVAPGVALDLVAGAAHWPLDEGLARERAAFLELRQGPQARALRHLFFAERAATGRAHDFGAPGSLGGPEVRVAVVVGGGTMGAGIALALAGAGIHVTTLERDGPACDRARATLAGLYAEAVKRGRMTADQAAAALAGRHAFTDRDADLPEADLAIEAAFEDLGVKQAIFARLAAVLPPGALMATNTSYLDVNAIFAGVPGPGRCLGLHFFAPAQVMKLVEVVRAAGTAPETLGAAFALARRLGKVAVEAGACDGFIGNRILTRYRSAMDALLLQGATPGAVDAALEGWGMAMGPYAVQDLSGLEIAFANRRRKGGANPVADRLVEGLGRLGRKTGAGWFDYPEGRAVDSALVEGVIREEAARVGVRPRAVGAEEIVERALMAMIAEGLAILEEGVAARAADIDLVLVHGYGFPRWRGGPMHLAAERGPGAVRDALVGLAAAEPGAWRVPGGLERLMAESDGG